MHKFLSSNTIFKFSANTRSIHNPDHIKSILYKNNSRATVYSGAQSHLIKLTKRNKGHTIFYDSLANEIYKYLHDGKIETQQSFDNWHDNICNFFISELKKLNIIAKYGMAQKWINLAMKYVYTFQDSDTIDKSKFEFCHMILDGYTYYPSSNIINYKQQINLNGYTINTPFYYTNVLGPKSKRLTSWSKLTYKEYISCQMGIRDYFRNNPITYGNVCFLDTQHLSTKSTNYKLSVFESEFFIW